MLSLKKTVNNYVLINCEIIFISNLPLASRPFTSFSLLFFRTKDQTSVPKEYLTAGGSICLLIIIFFGLSAGTLCSIVGFLYPALKSFQAIEHRASSSAASSSGDVTQWLIYWVVFAFFSIIENFIDVLLYWIPFYYAFKVAFLLWCMLPQTRGAKFLYDSFLKDFLKSKESMIDKALKDAKATSAVAASSSSSSGENVKKVE